jgi:hypothetical protein
MVNNLKLVLQNVSDKFIRHLVITLFIVYYRKEEKKNKVALSK